MSKLAELIKEMKDPGRPDFMLPVSIVAQVIEHLDVRIVGQVGTLVVEIPETNVVHIMIEEVAAGLVLDVHVASSVTINVATEAGVKLDVNIATSQATINVDLVSPIGQVGPAIGLDGVGDFVSVPNHANLNPGAQDFTIVIKFKARTLSIGIIPIDKGQVSVDGYFVQLDGPYLIRLCTSQAGASQSQYTAAQSSLLGADHVVHITRSGVNAKIFIDGVDCTGTHVDIIDPQTTTKPLNLCRSQTYAQYLNGLFYFYRFYLGKAFTQAEVTEDFNNPNSPIQDNLEMWLKCSEGTGTSLADSTGNGHNATLTGGTWVSGKGGVSASVNVNLVAQVQNVKIDIAAQTMGNVNVNIAGQIQNVTVTLAAQTVDIMVLAPSGKMVSVGKTVANQVAQLSKSFSAGIPLTLLQVTGRGKISGIAFIVDALNTTTDIKGTCIRVAIDGSLKMEISVGELDYEFNGWNIRSQCTVTGTWYRATVVNPLAAATAAKTCTDDAAKWERVGGFINIESEYTTSFTVSVYNLSYGGFISAEIVYGPYVSG